MNLWERYNPERPLGAVLGERLGVPFPSGEDKRFFEALKRHLTRKELRCWVMAEGGEPGESIAVATGMSADEVANATRKAVKKLRQPKLRQALLAVQGEGEETEFH